jgi:PAS domain S-box-containing protein
MRDPSISIQELLEENFNLKQRIKELEHSKAELNPAENALRTSEKMFRTLVENSHDLIYTISPEGVFKYVSPSCTTLLGYPVKHVLGKLFQQFIHPDDVGNVVLSLRQLIETGQRQNFIQYRVQHMDGSWRWYMSRGNPIRNEAGAVVGYQGSTRDITEQKLTEKALIDSEERFRSLVETTSDWIWETDARGIYTYASPKVKDMLGYEPSEVLGKTPLDLMPPDEAERVAQIMSKYFEEAKPFMGFENLSLHKDGRVVVLETSGVPIINEHGQLTGYRGIDRDVTERKKAEEALKWKTALLEAQLNTSIDGIMVVDENKKRILINKRLIDLWNIPQHVLDDEDNTALLNYVATLVKYPGKLVEKVNYLYDHPDETCSYEVEYENGLVLDRYTAPVIDENGHYYGRIWTFRDVTSRALAEAALRESETKFKVLTEKAVIGVYLIQDLIFKYVNPRLMDILGYPENEILMKEIKNFIVPEDWPMVRENFRMRLAGEVDSIHYELRMIRKSGEIVFVEAYGSQITYKGQPTIIGTVLDISDRKRAEEEMRYREKLQGVLEMAGGICHELNQPMQTISGYSDLLLTNLSNDQIYEKLYKIMEQIKRMGAITNKIMTINHAKTQDYAGISRIITINNKDKK